MPHMNSYSRTTAAVTGELNLIASQPQASVSADRKQNLADLIDSITETLSILDKLFSTISSFDTVLQFPLYQICNDLVLKLGEMRRLGEKCNFHVPIKVLNLIDEGKNPDVHLQDSLEIVIAKNQIVKGKTDVFKCLRNHLLEQLDQTFPGEAEGWREIRAASAARPDNLRTHKAYY